MRPTKTAIAIGVMTLGYAATIVGVIAGGWGWDDLQRLGEATVTCALLWFFVSRGRRSEEAIYRAGRRDGYDDGWDECARIGRPSPVVSVNKLQRLAANDS